VDLVIGLILGGIALAAGVFLGERIGRRQQSKEEEDPSGE
jgi:uncharacterized protein YneF (UPF0154 family)